MTAAHRRRALVVALLLALSTVVTGAVGSGRAVAAPNPDLNPYLFAHDPDDRIAFLNPGLHFGVGVNNAKPGEQVTFSVWGATVVSTADADGNAVTPGSPFTVPADSSPVDDVDVEAKTASGDEFGVDTSVEAPLLRAAPNLGGPGGSTRVDGSGFGSGTTVRFNASDGVAPASVTASATGTFVVDATVPATSGDSKTLTASDGLRSAAATLTTAPARLFVGYSAVSPGNDTTVMIEGFRSMATLSLTQAGGAEQGVQLPATVVVNAYGTARFTISIPSNACAGSEVLTVRDPVIGTTASGPLDVNRNSADVLQNRAVTGCSLPAGSALISPNRRYRLVVQGDGNVVLYDGSRARWSTGTSGSAVRLVMQSDNNLVLYAGSRALWSSGTAGYDGSLNLTVTDDGELLLGGRNGNGYQVDAAWTPALTDRLARGDVLRPGRSLVSSNGAYRLVQQNDGALVLYGAGGAVVWAVRDYWRGSRTILQSDGNLVAYRSDGSPVFAAGTVGRGNVLLVQNDGNLVIYDAAGRAVWSIR